MPDTKRLQELPFLGRACGGKHLRSRVLCDLNGRESDTARTAVHEDALASRLPARSVAAESGTRPAAGRGKLPRSWRQYRPPAHG